MNPAKLTPALVRLMSLTCGATVANLYYNQPLLAQFQQEFNVSVKSVGLVVTLTQAGYALGMFTLVPLGDKLERKKLILIMTGLSAVALAISASASNIAMLAASALLIGLTCVSAQLIIPFAAELAEPHQRGKALGTIVGGILLGILLGRTVSGLIGGTFGWRAMYWTACGLMLLLAYLLKDFLPEAPPTFKGSYGELLKSTLTLVKQQPALRESAFVASMLFASFSVFWATLVFFLQTPPYDYGARGAGLFGLLGAAGALTAPLVGKFIDKAEPRDTIRLSVIVTLLSFILFWFAGKTLPGLMLGIIFMDLGVQSGHVGNQTRVFALVPGARSRLNMVYMTCYFLGGSFGSLVGAYCWNHWQWSGVCGAGVAFTTLGLLPLLRHKLAVTPRIELGLGL